MNFLILRVLQHSELGMFHAYRRSGREGSRQRAINFDRDVVDRVFPAANDYDRIPLLLRYDTDDGPQTFDHSLKRQAKNWRFEGNCPTDELYDFVEPGCLFAMQIEASSFPATGAWVVFSKDDLTAQTVLADGSTSGLLRAGMIALEPEESVRVRRLLSVARPDMFTLSVSWDPSAMTDTSNPTSLDAIPSSNGTRKLPPNAERLVGMLGDAGHRLPTAVADIIDNSIEAGATEIDITFDPPNNGHGRWMVIRDNGTGMDAQTLDEALRIGSDTTYGVRSLGKYGYGLKGASWSQARAVTVVTKQAGQPLIHLGWDKQDMADFSVIEAPLEPWEDDATKIPQKGTAVLWKHMKMPLSAPSAKGVSPHVAEIQELTRHLELVFHRFLEGEAKGRPQLTIRINGIPIEQNGPAGHPLAQPFDSKVIRVPLEIGHADVRVQPFLLPTEDELKDHHSSIGLAAGQKAIDRIGYGGRRNETQGLFIYRNDRLIKWGGWHGIWKTNEEKTKLARVIVEFDKLLDEAFQINISKQEVSLPGYLQEQIKSLAEPVRKASFAKYGRRSSPKPAPPVPTPTQGLRAVDPTSTAPQSPGDTQGGSINPGLSDPAPQPPSVSPITIRPVTTAKFAWKISDGFNGDRVLQVSSTSSALVELARAVESNPEATAALAAFLEELDQVDVQQALIEGAAGV
ncbi:ATP-binding protein [Mesorhizobium sp. M0435]|uniref:ATP-binding protein n=1 Tax=Mesorhizobium sp. M0435 TaxID=2956944 RepID=UPI0033365F05